MEALDAALSGFDALLTPTTPSAAIPVRDCDQQVAPMSRLTRAVNLLDHCAVALPCGFNAAGLPLSPQVIGRDYDENATEWHERHPSL